MFPTLTEDDLHAMTQEQLVKLVMAFSGAVARLSDGQAATLGKLADMTMAAANERGATLALLGKEGCAAVGLPTDQA